MVTYIFSAGRENQLVMFIKVLRNNEKALNIKFSSHRVQERDRRLLYSFQRPPLLEDVGAVKEGLPGTLCGKHTPGCQHSL